MKKESKKVGGKLRSARVIAGMTQQEVADAIGIDVTAVSRMENNRNMPRLETLAAYCKAVGCALSEVVA